MRAHLILGAPILACTLLVCGCATPKPALDQANNTATLTVSLEAELREFRRVQTDIAQARIESIRRQVNALATYEVETAFEERIQRAAGNDAYLRLYTTLKELADSRAQDEKDLQDALAANEQALGQILSPLPETAAKLTATQKALLALGQELSPQERLKITAAFVKEINKTVQENRKKIADAAAATPTAPVQPPASPSNP